MRRAKSIAAACAAGVLAGLLAGCGGSSTTPTVPSGNGSTNASGAGPGPLSHTGAVGTMSAPGSGALDPRSPEVIRQIDARLVSYYTSRGFTGVTAICTATGSTSASCRITGTNSKGQTSSAVVTLSLNPTSGLLKVTRVSP